jgi:predicted Rossmann fold nucleotide-binding protein DprA/Smf involved in DNA uptake
MLSTIHILHDQKPEPNQQVNKSAIHTAVLKLMSYTPTPIDDTLRLRDTPPAVVQAALLELEIVGRIHCLSKNFITLREER